MLTSCAHHEQAGWARMHREGVFAKTQMDDAFADEYTPAPPPPLLDADEAYIHPRPPEHWSWCSGISKCEWVKLINMSIRLDTYLWADWRIDIMIVILSMIISTSTDLMESILSKTWYPWESYPILWESWYIYYFRYIMCSPVHHICWGS